MSLSDSGDYYNMRLGELWPGWPGDEKLLDCPPPRSELEMDVTGGRNIKKSLRFQITSV